MLYDAKHKAKLLIIMHCKSTADFKCSSSNCDRKYKIVATESTARGRGNLRSARNQSFGVEYIFQKTPLQLNQAFEKARPLDSKSVYSACGTPINTPKTTIQDQLWVSGLRTGTSKTEFPREKVRQKFQVNRSLEKNGYSARAERDLRTPQIRNPQITTSLRTFSTITDLSLRALFLNIIPALPSGFQLRMGQTLSEPVTKKESSSDENHSLKVGASCMQGWRINMEDEHVHKLCFNDEKDTHFFAVFDGHGGQGAAQYASKELDSAIINHSAYRRSDLITACKGGFLAVDEAWNKETLGKEETSGCTAVAVILKGNKIYCLSVKSTENAVKYIGIYYRSPLVAGDSWFVSRSGVSNSAGHNGCVYIDMTTLSVCSVEANAGDSRAVASVRGHAQLLSFDHKPNHEREMRRINAAGGFVEFNRVNGNLALSRALGDFVFKRNEHRSAEEQIVTGRWYFKTNNSRVSPLKNTQINVLVPPDVDYLDPSFDKPLADPDVIVKDISKDHEFIVLACDGIWDVLNNQDVVEFVRERLAKKMEPDVICEELMNKCLAAECAVGGVGCDNMTVMVVALKQNGSFDELCQKCAVPKRDPIPHSCLLASYPDYVKGGISCL